MSDDKRLLRQLKRSIKHETKSSSRETGNVDLFSKEVSTDADAFSLGDDPSALMNERHQWPDDDFKDRQSDQHFVRAESSGRRI